MWINRDGFVYAQVLEALQDGMIKPQKWSRKANIQYLPHEDKQITWIIYRINWCKERGSPVRGQQRHCAVWNDLRNVCGVYISRHAWSNEIHKSAVLSLVPCLTLFMLNIFSTLFDITSKKKEKENEKNLQIFQLINSSTAFLWRRNRSGKGRANVALALWLWFLFP